jgi:hypothetical protein
MHVEQAGNHLVLQAIGASQNARCANACAVFGREAIAVSSDFLLRSASARPTAVSPASTQKSSQVPAESFQMLITNPWDDGLQIGDTSHEINWRIGHS